MIFSSKPLFMFLSVWLIHEVAILTQPSDTVPTHAPNKLNNWPAAFFLPDFHSVWQTVSPHDCHRVKGLGKASLVDELLRDTREPDVCVCVSFKKRVGRWQWWYYRWGGLLGLCFVNIVMGPLRKAGQLLYKQTCCHQQIVSRKEQWGGVFLLSVGHSNMQSSRNVFLPQTAESEVESQHCDETGLLATLACLVVGSRIFSPHRCPPVNTWTELFVHRSLHIRS